jgi:hypothetical protein
LLAAVFHEGIISVQQVQGDAAWPWATVDCALSSVVEHYLHTIKTAILAIFSYLFPAFIFVAST